MPGSERHSPGPDDKGTASKPRNGSGRTAGGLQRRFVDTLAWLITAAWSVSFLYGIVDHEYQPPATLHALMLAVAGAAFGSSFVKRGGE